MHEPNAEADRNWSPAWTLVVASLALMMAFLDAPDTFVAGFRSALWIAVAFSATGIPLALTCRRAPAPKPHPAAAPGAAADHRVGQREPRLARSQPPAEN